jgi:hypothetical protein
MSRSVRSNILFVLGLIIFVAIQWFSSNYEDLNLPEWLQFIKTAYGSLVIFVISSSSFLILMYYNYRETRSIEGMSRRSKNIHKWLFYVVAGIIILGIPLEIVIFISKLHASG